MCRYNHGHEITKVMLQIFGVTCCDTHCSLCVRDVNRCEALPISFSLNQLASNSLRQLYMQRKQNLCREIPEETLKIAWRLPNTERILTSSFFWKLGRFCKFLIDPIAYFYKISDVCMEDNICYQWCSRGVFEKDLALPISVAKCFLHKNSQRNMKTW